MNKPFVQSLAIAILFLNFHPAVAQQTSLPDQYFVQDIDRDLGEQFEDGSFDKEKGYISQVVATFVKLAQDVHTKTGDQAMYRAAHAKALACLKAKFTVHNENLPPELRVGIFADDRRTFNAWARVSNSDQNPHVPAAMQNTRGFALKLLGVEGPKLLEPELNAKTQDLLMVAAEAFIASDNKNYSEIADGRENNLGLLWRMGIRKVLALIENVRGVQKEANPLKLNFFSTVPYRLGSELGPKAAIKFALSPCATNDFSKFQEGNTGSESLQKNLSDTITEANRVCFDFKIQFRQGSDPVEDATVRWTGPFLKVGEVWLDSDLNNREDLASREPFCEKLSFNPWHTTEFHRPLGRTNRARRAAYMASSVFRHQANAAPASEPSESSFNEIK